MIKSFHIRNLATIEDIELDLRKGFSVLTGETGTGKSIIIEGIKLVLGEKGFSEMIRTGKKETSVEAIFEIPHDRSLQDKRHPKQENEVFIQRIITGKGTGKGYIDGILVPIKKLSMIKNDLIDIYGQNDHVFLRNTEYQLDYLDSYADAIALRSRVSEAARELRRLSREKRDLEIKEKEREKRLDFLGFQIKEIEDADLQADEEEELHRKRNILKNAEKVSVLTEEALDLTYARDNSISSLLTKLRSVLDNLKEYDKTFQTAHEVAAQFDITIQDLSDSLMRFREKHIASPDKLEKLEERLSQIEGLKRKYGNSVQEILAYLKEAYSEFKELSTSHERLQEIGTDLVKSFNDYKTLTEELTSRRKESACTLEKQVEREITLLGMKKACFRISMNSSIIDDQSMEKAKDRGSEEIEFLISPNPGEDLRPLRKIASGGELSRIMLALKSIGKETKVLKTLIFDEIDAGIGGKTAEYVAKKLQKLADLHQVICITHLPQIASFASHHFRIDKRVRKGRTYTIAKPLSFEQRVEEIARLLAGSRITDTALKNAREMLLHNLNPPPGTQTN
jgi:DNA repair protein RecN (Recombination protein N)